MIQFRCRSIFLLHIILILIDFDNFMKIFNYFFVEVSLSNFVDDKLVSVLFYKRRKKFIARMNYRNRIPFKIIESLSCDTQCLRRQSYKVQYKTKLKIIPARLAT